VEGLLACGARVSFAASGAGVNVPEHITFGVRGPKSRVQSSVQLVNRIEQLPGKSWLRNGTGRHTFLLFRRV